MFGMLSVRWNPSYLIFWVLRKILHSGWALICLYWRVIILCNTTQYRFELEPNNTTFSLVTRSVTFCHQVVNKLPIWNCWIAFYLKQPPCTIDKLQSCLLQLENMSFQRPAQDFQCQLYQIINAKSFPCYFSDCYFQLAFKMTSLDQDEFITRTRIPEDVGKKGNEEEVQVF